MDTLSIWDDQLITYGNSIIVRRKAFIEELNEMIGFIHNRLSGGKEELSVHYDPNIDNAFFAKKLEQSIEKDILSKTTGIGPHRDDIRFMIKDVDIRKFGSQGQQRTSALSLKLAEIEIVKKSIHNTPVLLLDDVLTTGSTAGECARMLKTAGAKEVHCAVLATRK